MSGEHRDKRFGPKQVKTGTLKRKVVSSDSLVRREKCTKELNPRFIRHKHGGSDPLFTPSDHPVMTSHWNVWCKRISGMSGVAPMWVRLATNGIIPGLFQVWEQISVHFGPAIWKRPGLIPCEANLTYFWAAPDTPSEDVFPKDETTNIYLTLNSRN